MMNSNIYVCHSKSYDYKNILYNSIKNSELFYKNKVILPHDTDMFKSSKDAIASSDLIIADISNPSTGMGIELGWADSFSKRIIYVCNDSTEISKSLLLLSKEYFLYKDCNDLIQVFNNINKII